LQSPCLNIELKEKFKLNKGITDFLERVADKSQRWGETVASPIRKTDMAKETGKNPRTITRYINQLEELGLIKTETKRGMNGGTLVVFNTDMLNFEPKENPITSDTKQAKEIREQVFPKAPTKVPKRRYRTKTVRIACIENISEKILLWSSFCLCFAISLTPYTGIPRAAIKMKYPAKESTKLTIPKLSGPNTLVT
jgi:DNA-binding transcriptional regulator YhcF (GntR family)